MLPTLLAAVTLAAAARFARGEHRRVRGRAKREAERWLRRQLAGLVEDD